MLLNKLAVFLSPFFVPDNNRKLINSYRVIVRVRVVLKRTVVGDRRFDNLSGSHPQSQKTTSAQVVETSVTNNSSFQNYPHPDDHTIRTTDTPGFKPFTRKLITQQIFCLLKIKLGSVSFVI